MGNSVLYSASRNFPEKEQYRCQSSEMERKYNERRRKDRGKKEINRMKGNE
jgi:hypothetical protein